ncbi:hypothetical protein TSUD_93090 [Trifolium subterraneum]|uniref:Uncharacterized protein n=1 Tax=Trifolium subterraneum TaxID=3900 RepID=A0A2Z6P852_TRISU|nr:hypothetical protein TSUD_93090 [Trifolium subterraneum]
MQAGGILFIPAGWGIPDPRLVGVWGYTFYPRMKLGWVWGNPNFMGLGLGMTKSAPAPLPCLIAALPKIQIVLPSPISRCYGFGFCWWVRGRFSSRSEVLGGVGGEELSSSEMVFWWWWRCFGSCFLIFVFCFPAAWSPLVSSSLSSATLLFLPTCVRRCWCCCGFELLGSDLAVLVFVGVFLVFVSPAGVGLGAVLWCCLYGGF